VKVDRLCRGLAVGVSMLGLVGLIAVPASASSVPPIVRKAFQRVCENPPPGMAYCHALRRTDVAMQPNTGVPQGYGPADLQSAYNLPSSSAGVGQTVAVVDAFDNPTAEADLAVYRAQFGLPPCTTANGCFHKVDQNGGTNYPRFNLGWAQEIALDLDMVSAICPNCHILLVEANTPFNSDLYKAEDRAALLGANAISNSWGGSEYSGETSSDSHFNHPGVAITASTGDGGYGVEYPAASRYVTAVGGTSLTRASNARGWSETVWYNGPGSGTGSGCSAYMPKPSWQTDTGCARRTVGDVAAVADPYTGVAVYYNGAWMVFGGTSVASPIVASTYALAQNPAGAVTDGSTPYGHPASLNDVTSGSNGSCGTYLCQGQVGYDGPTGLGTPDGVAAFIAATSLPAAPSDLAVSNPSQSASSLSLSWADNSSNETGFKIERKSGSGAYAQIATVGAGVTSYADSSLAANTTYTYRVRAYNARGDSAYSNEASGTTAKGAYQVFDNTSARIVYSGNWQQRAVASAIGGSVSYSASPSAGATLTWNGTDLTVVMVTGPQMGIAYVVVDGLIHVVDLYSPTQQYQQSVYVQENLASGPHTVKVTPAGAKNAASTGNTIALDALEVR